MTKPKSPATIGPDTPTMGKRIGWKLSRSIRGTFEVVEVLEGGIIGRDIIDFPSKEDAEKLIDSDGAASSDHAPLLQK
jgi:hypothetical protein